MIASGTAAGWRRSSPPASRRGKITGSGQGEGEEAEREVIRSYRVGQTEFLQHCIDELLRHTDDNYLEGLATQQIVATASGYVDHVVQQVLTSYAESRDAWLRDRSAMLAIRIRELLRRKRVGGAATERALDYRLDRHDQALVLRVDEQDADTHARLRHVVAGASASLAPGAVPLVVPCDEATAEAWLPIKASVAAGGELTGGHQSRAGCRRRRRRTSGRHRRVTPQPPQATSAQAVALAAGPEWAPLTPFDEVAPIAMLCADLEPAKAWIHETLGELAADSTSNEGQRDTARVFLQTGGSYTATAEQLYLQRNTAPYRVRQAEEVRGRLLRDGRLDVELALLACHWLKGAVLQPA